MNWFRRVPPPPPPKRWYQQPVVILTVAAMFVLAPVGAVYNGMSEEIKKLEAEKAEKQTIEQMLEYNKDQLEVQREDNQIQENAIKENQQRIEGLLREQAVIKERQKIAPPTEFKVKKEPEVTEEAVVKRVVEKFKKFITREVFEFYEQLPPEKKKLFRKLHPAYEALPPPE